MRRATRQPGQFNQPVSQQLRQLPGARRVWMDEISTGEALGRARVQSGSALEQRHTFALRHVADDVLKLCVARTGVDRNDDAIPVQQPTSKVGADAGGASPVDSAAASAGSANGQRTRLPHRPAAARSKTSARTPPPPR